MANFDSTITLATAGTARNFTGFGFQPTHLTFRVCAKGATSASSAVFTYGTVDVTGYMTCTTTYSDSTGYQSKNYTDRCVSVWERVSGTLTEVLRANFNSFTADGFKLDVITQNANYQVFVEATDV